MISAMGISYWEQGWSWWQVNATSFPWLEASPSLVWPSTGSRKRFEPSPNINVSEPKPRRRNIGGQGVESVMSTGDLEGGPTESNPVFSDGETPTVRVLDRIDHANRGIVTLAVTANIDALRDEPFAHRAGPRVVGRAVARATCLAATAASDACGNEFGRQAAGALLQGLVLWLVRARLSSAV